MILISHRGNINGLNSKLENSKSQIDYVINDIGIECEVDVRIVKGEIYLGHDYPAEKVNIEFLAKNRRSLWIHCKNFEALDFFSSQFKECKFNFFWHHKDLCTLTSNGTIWYYPSKEIYSNGVNVLPEKFTNPESLKERFRETFGVCSDYIGKFLY